MPGQRTEKVFEAAIEHHQTTEDGYKRGDRKTARIDKIVAKVHEAIEKLREHRMALIPTTVIGKIDVRGFQPEETPCQ